MGRVSSRGDGKPSKFHLYGLFFGRFCAIMKRYRRHEPVDDHISHIGDCIIAKNCSFSVRYKLQDTKIQDMKKPYGNSRSISCILYRPSLLGAYLVSVCWAMLSDKPKLKDSSIFTQAFPRKAFSEGNYFENFSKNSWQTLAIVLYYCSKWSETARFPPRHPWMSGGQ